MLGSGALWPGLGAGAFGAEGGATKKPPARSLKRPASGQAAGKRPPLIATPRARAEAVRTSPGRQPKVAGRKAPAVAPAGTSLSKPDPGRSKAIENERSVLREKLEQLRAEIAAAEASRTDAADALSGSERAIAAVNRKLRALDSERSVVQNGIEENARERNVLDVQIRDRQAQLGELIRRQYFAGTPEPLRLVLSARDPNRVQRDLHYLGYLQRAEAGALQELEASRGQLERLYKESEVRNAELAAIALEQRSGQEMLIREREARQQTLTRVSSRLAARQREAAALERDEKRLTRLVEEIAKLIERQELERRAREKKLRERERESLKARQIQDSRSAGTSTASPVPRVPASSGSTGTLPLPAFAGDFLGMKGRLRLPVRGSVATRYGSARAEGGPSWKGLFIRAEPGTEVRAVAAGRIVFADWLRGFGNLLIVDHGGQYLSIYGNNESLSREAGDTVKSDDVLARVGGSGVGPESGLYFEMRFRGRPFDPLTWAQPR